MTNGSSRRRTPESLPPLAPEDYVCTSCDLVFSTLDVRDALVAISAVPQEIRDLLIDVPDSRIRRRPRPDTWSAIEYVCHLRDVYATYTIRLHRARTENSPAVEPMFSDLRAMRFRYGQLPIAPVLGELDDHVAGLLEEAAGFAPADWQRTMSRRPGEVRTARWLVRQALHEGRHHLNDVRTIAGRA